MNAHATAPSLPRCQCCPYCGQAVTQEQWQRYIAGLFRGFLVELAHPDATGTAHETKGERLLAYVASEEFGKRLRGLLHAADDLRNLQAEERKRHEAAWGAQEEILRGIEQFTGRIQGRVRGIVEGRE
jgi:hypothetical protein